MNREPVPCSDCFRFVPGKAETDTGHCTGYDRAAKPDDSKCVLFVQQGSRAARIAAKNSLELLAELQRRHPETISRASAISQH